MREALKGHKPKFGCPFCLGTGEPGRNGMNARFVRKVGRFRYYVCSVDGGEFREGTYQSQLPNDDGTYDDIV